MEDINFNQMLSYILQKIWLAMAILLVVFAGGEAYTAFLKTPLYKSSTNLVLISDSAQNTAITTNDVTLSNNLVKTYSEIVTSRNVLSRVISNLNLNTTFEQFKKSVKVSSVTNTQLITIEVSDPDATKAEQIANEIAKVFKKEINNIYGINNVSIVDKAVVAEKPYNINIVKESIIYLAAGIILGLGAVMLLYFLDNTVKDTQTIEDRVGLTVIGVVPMVEERK